jgi:2-dehydropantoate 2-reductase
LLEDPVGHITAVYPIKTIVSESTISGTTTSMQHKSIPSSSSFDVIVLACKAYGLVMALEAIAPYVHPGVAILPLLNGLAHIDAIVERFPDATVWGGTCGIVATLQQDGTVKRMTESQFVTAGIRDSSKSASCSSNSSATEIDGTLLTSLIDLMRRAGIEANASDAIVQKMWEKWTFLATLGASTSVFDGSIGEILATGDAGESYIHGVFQECDAVAIAEGGGASVLSDDDRDQRTQAYNRVLGDKNSIVRASMARDMANGNPTEADHILGDMIHRAKKHKIETPLLAIAYARLVVYENQRKNKLLTN